MKTFFAHSLLLTWLITCLILFVYVSRVGFVQIVTIPNWEALLNVLNRISLLRYSLDLLRALLGVLLFSLACLSLGLGILRRWVNSQSSNLAIGITAFVMGEIICSVVFLTIISVYRLTPIFVIGFLSLVFLAGFPTLKQFVAHLPRPSFSVNFSRSEMIVLGFIVGIFLLSLLSSSARLSYDAVTEYFSHAKIMAVSRLPIFFYYKDSFVVSSFHPGILLTALIQVFGDQSARMLSWVNALAILLMGLTLGKELGLAPRALLWFLVLMATSTAFVDLLGDGKIELISTAPILTAMYWMLRSLEEPTKRTFMLIGWLVGFAFISRPYNIFLLSIFMVFFYVSQFYILKKSKRFDFKQYIRPAIWILLPMFILGLFHLLENWFFLKSPIAPLTYAKDLGTTDWQWQFDPTNLALYRLLYPLVLSFLNSPQSLGTISPLFISFLPLLLMRKIRGNLHISLSFRQLALAVVITLLLWIILFFTVVEIRYVFFLWIVLFLAMAQVVETATQHLDTIIRSLLHPLLIALLAFMSIRVLLIALITYSPLDNMDQAHCYDINFCTFLESVNQTAARGDRVLVLNAYRYYLRPDLFACSSRSDEYPTLEELAHRNSPDFWVEVYRRGYHFLTYEKNFALRHSRFGEIPDPMLAPSWLRVTVFSSSLTNNETVYRIEAVHPPFQAEIFCLQNPTGNWQLRASPEL